MSQTMIKQRPGAGAGILLFNSQGQLLLGKRKSLNGDGTWSVPGGHLEWMEAWEECAIREVKEETGLIIEHPRVIEFRNYIDRENGQHFLDAYVTAEVIKEEPKLLEPEKCEGWRWFNLNDLPAPLFRDYGKIWSDYLRKEQTKSELLPGVDYVGVTTAMFCHDGRGRFLLNKRSNKCRDEHGKWDAWGGRVEFGETVEEAARRELAEECGATIKKIEQAGVSTALRVDPQGRPTHWLVVVFLVEIDPQTVRNMEPEKFEEIGWFEPGKWPKNVHSMLLKDFAIAAKKL